MSKETPSKPVIHPRVHGFLVLILCLLAWNVFVLVRSSNYRYDRYTNLVVGLMLLFSHIAFQYTKTGWPSKVMKVVAVAWVAFGLLYMFGLIVK